MPSLICYEVRQMTTRQTGTAPRGNRNRKPYWFHSDGKPFPSEYIDIDWSRSTITSLDKSGSLFISQLGIMNHGTPIMMQIAAHRFQEIIVTMRSAAEKLRAEKEIDARGLHLITIHNVIATFDIMMRRFGDRAFFCIH